MCKESNLRKLVRPRIRDATSRNEEGKNITDERSVSRRRATSCHQVLKRVQKAQRQRRNGRTLADVTLLAVQPQSHLGFPATDAGLQHLLGAGTRT